jgi:hypothetical protein
MSRRGGRRISKIVRVSPTMRSERERSTKHRV